MTGLFVMQEPHTVLIQGDCQCFMNESMGPNHQAVVVSTALIQCLGQNCFQTHPVSGLQNTFLSADYRI